MILSLQGLEDTLLPDFLEDLSIQYLKSVRLFSKRFKLWLLSALEGFPAILQISKLKGRVPHKTQILRDEELNVATRVSFIHWWVVHSNPWTLMREMDAEPHLPG